MRLLGLRGARRGGPVWTTRPDRRADRAPDLVDRQFRAQRPDQLWVVETYVAPWSGTVFGDPLVQPDVCGWIRKTTLIAPLTAR